MNKFSFKISKEQTQCSIQTDVFQFYFNLFYRDLWYWFTFDIKGGLAYLFCINYNGHNGEFEKVEWYEKKRTGLFLDASISILRLGIYFTPITFFKR